MPRQTKPLGRRRRAPQQIDTGALLALLHLCGAIDMHYDNIIASNGYPIPVDLECMLTSMGGLDVRRLSPSIFDVGILPRARQEFPDGPVCDVTFLGAVPNQDTGLKRIVIYQPDTNDSALRLEQILLKCSKNIFRTRNLEYRYNGFEGEVLDGFRQIYRIFVGHKGNFHRYVQFEQVARQDTES